MIPKDFIELTDKIIAGLKEKNVVFANGNVLLAKPSLEEKTKGGIVLATEYREFEKRKAGFAKVIAIPSNLDPVGGDVDIKPGDYVFFTYVAENPIYYEGLSKVIGVDIPKETLFYTGDSEVIAKVDKEKVEKE